MFKPLHKLAFTVLSALFFLSASAQESFYVDNTTAHMGEILFQSPKKVVFAFKNKGDKPFEILNVLPSCGCTQAEWTRGSIPAGGKGEITAVYDAEMLGTFHKELAVYCTASETPIYLSLEGRVVTSMLDYTGDFPYDLGKVRINTNYLEFDDVNRGDHPVAELQVFNQERAPYRPELMHLPSYLSVKSVPEVIAGGRAGRLYVTLDSEKLGLLGLNQTRIYLSRYPGDKVGETNEILVSAVLLPDFSNMSEADLAEAAHMELSAESLDFNLKDPKAKLTQAITITNTGHDVLNFRTVQVFNQAISVSLGNRSLQPGKSTQLKVSVNKKYLKKAKNRPRVLLITNDPKNAKQTINVNLEQ